MLLFQTGQFACRYASVVAGVLQPDIPVGGKGGGGGGGGLLPGGSFVVGGGDGGGLGPATAGGDGSYFNGSDGASNGTGGALGAAAGAGAGAGAVVVAIDSGGGGGGDAVTTGAIVGAAIGGTAAAAAALAAVVVAYKHIRAQQKRHRMRDPEAIAAVTPERAPGIVRIAAGRVTRALFSSPGVPGGSRRGAGTSGAVVGAVHVEFSLPIA